MTSAQARAQDAKKEKVFRDPVHDLIVIAPDDDFILDLIDTPEMQRLRRIRQLGMSCFTYQGAEHSRFTHSLGTYHCVCRILESLIRNHRGQGKIPRIIKKIGRSVKAAGLLHDLGHGPFSHVFERALGSQGLKHEDWTTKIIESTDTEVNKALRKHNIDPTAVANIIRKSPLADSLAIDIISSELDADRMDYLLRDSLMCGVKYGVFDLEWILHTMYASEVQKLTSGEKPMKLCADATKGIRAVEGYVLSRIQMYEQVYYHKTTRACEGLLSQIIEYAQWLVKSGWVPPDTPLAIRKLLSGTEVTIEEYLSLDDFCFTSTLMTWSVMDCDNANQEDLRSLVRLLVERGQPFKSIDVEHKMRDVGKMEQALKEDTLRFHYFLDAPGNTVYKGVLYSLKGEKEPEELINSTIYVLTSNGTTKPVETESEVLKGLSGLTLQKDRLYYDRTKEQDFEHLFSKFGLS
ncbi:MAG: HD domain-containing protein [Armatimonadota bacterium]|nr:HD domain-containing protein [Armatimonadota bacterium]